MLVIKYTLFGIHSCNGKSTGSDHRLTYLRHYDLEWVWMRSNLEWPPARHRTTISSLALSTCASPGVSDQLYFVWNSSKRKLTGSDHRLTYLRHYDLECVLMRLWLPQAPHWATKSSLVLSTSSSPGASDQLYFVWDSSNGKSTGSDHLLTYIRHYDLECVRIRSNCGLPPAPHWAATSYLALLTFASTDASDQIYFVWDSSNGKSTGSDHCLTYVRHYDLEWVWMRSNLGWPPAPHWATISSLALSTSASPSASK
jgi:hypothetical protein